MTTKPAWMASKLAQEPSEAELWEEGATPRQREILKELGILAGFHGDLTRGEAAQRINTVFAERRARESIA